MINVDGDSYLDVHEAAGRLGVKPETLYAYVSRGMLRSYLQGIRRRRLYLLNEIEALLQLRPGGEAAPAAARGDTASSAEAPATGVERAPSVLPAAEPWASER
ncbi:MAG: helix-turn-helix domain-containing protein [Dehalococcoidia bacterium]